MQHPPHLIALHPSSPLTQALVAWWKDAVHVDDEARTIELRRPEYSSEIKVLKGLGGSDV